MAFRVFDNLIQPIVEFNSICAVFNLDPKKSFIDKREEIFKRGVTFALGMLIHLIHPTTDLGMNLGLWRVTILRPLDNPIKLIILILIGRTFPSFFEPFYFFSTT